MPKLTQKQQRKNGFLDTRLYNMAVRKMDDFIEDYNEGKDFHYIMKIDLKEGGETGDYEREHYDDTDALLDYQKFDLKEIATLLIMNYLINDEDFCITNWDDRGWDILVGKCDCCKDIHISILYTKPKTEEEPIEPEKEEGEL